MNQVVLCHSGSAFLLLPDGMTLVTPWSNLGDDILLDPLLLLSTNSRDILRCLTIDIRLSDQLTSHKKLRTTHSFTIRPSLNQDHGSIPMSTLQSQM